MGRVIVAIGFALLFILAILVFLTRQSGSLRKNIADQATVPQIEIKNFSFRVFSDGKIKSELSAKQSHFVEPNKIEIFNNVRGYRYKENGLETLSCQLATAFFDGRSLGDIISTSQLTRAELDGDVRIRMDDRIVLTDSTTFDMESQVLYSDLPVRIIGDESEFSGDNGFTYDTTQHLLNMRGIIRGRLQFKGTSE